MKFMIGTAALCLLLTTSAPALAQEEPKPQEQGEHKPQDSKQPPAAEKAPPAKPEAGQPKEKPAPTEKTQPPPKTQNQDKPQQEQKAQEKQTQQQTKEQQTQQKQAQQQQQKAQQAQSHNASTARNAPNANARRIPDDQFRAHFGRDHHFRPARNGNRFQYGGYWFGYSQPWPSGWSYDDDCYIEDDDGTYYLVDALHTDFRLLVVIDVS